MMPHCVFNGCVNQFGHLNKLHGITFHTFPKNQRSREVWINLVRKQRGDPVWVPNNYSKICSLHFNPGHLFKTIRGKIRIIAGATPYFPTSNDNEGQSSSLSNQPVATSPRQTDEENSQGNEEIQIVENKEIVEEPIVDGDKMDVIKDVEKAPDEGKTPDDDVSPIPTVPDNQLGGVQEKPKDSNAMPLDKFKRRLVRAVARQLQQKKPEKEMWQDLKKEIGCDCKMLWQHMRALTLKKLKRLLPANDLLVNLKKIARFTTTDWLLFDLVLVHEKINVISINDGINGGDDIKEEPQCLHDLFELVKVHNVENLTGDCLTEAWIRVTLQYNSKGRQCSPMLLQLRWHQLKELTRARFYNFWCSYRGNQRMLDKAMEVKPTALQTAIAMEYKNVVTHMYPEWEKLIEERRVILSEEFAMNREARRQSEKTREENDLEIEVIEPRVETIELEVDSDEEQVSDDTKTSNVENGNVIEDSNESALNSEENKILTNTLQNTDASILDVEGLSDVESTLIPVENSDEMKFEVLPKITNVVGNIIEPTENTNELETNTIIETNPINELDDIETMTDNHHSTLTTKTKDDNAIQCDSDNELDETLPAKENNFKNIEITEVKSEYDLNNETNTINTEIFEKLQEEDDESGEDPQLSDSNIILCDSDDEMDKILEEKANNYIGGNKSQIDVNISEEKVHGNVNEDENDDEENETDIIHMSAEAEETVKKEKHDDGFDDIDFDDDQFEFVDDGIEFVDDKEREKPKNIDLKIEAPSDSDDESKMKHDDDEPKIDIKLLMNPTVYTQKLDLMNIFKSVDFTCVNDKKVIECAIFESKPVDKMALKDEDIIKFREQAIRGYDTDDTQSDSDVIQIALENEKNEVKSTSWLLQKPKNRSYNPIQICKNPDFNTRLKRLTAGFLSSSRNRVLLKECKPLTIDLHKAFEKKLIDGTMYLKSGDFKSAKLSAVDKINNEPTILPSVIPGMVITPSTTDNISTTVQDRLSFPLNIENNVTSERRKIIHLPDIDQVRRVNQSLLTAEVTPIRIDNKIDNEPCSEPVKTLDSNTPFVQPISLEPLIKIKTEQSQTDLDDKSALQIQVGNIQYESTSTKDLIASKINDQIINLSNQISEVDKNETATVASKKTVQIDPKQKNRIGRPRINVEKPKALLYKPTPKYVGQLSWSPKYPKNHIADSLLTIDTLSKILFLLNDNKAELCAVKKNKCPKKTHVETQSNLQSTPQSNLQSTPQSNLQSTPQSNPQSNLQSDCQIIPQVKENTSVQKTNEVQTVLKNCNNIIQPATTKCVQRTKTRGTGQRGRRRKIPVIAAVPKYDGIYCCWAREKIVNISKNLNTFTGNHGCNIYFCRCCCRNELIKFSTEKRAIPPGTNNKPFSTIVLSDDEDASKSTETNKKTVTIPDTQSVDKSVVATGDSNLDISRTNVTLPSDKVTIEILVPPITPQIDTSAKSTNADDNISKQVDIGVQSVMSQNNSSNSDQEKVDPKTQKKCKTVVYSADGPRYRNLVKSYAVVNDKSKPVERTLYLNSSQICNKPTRTPIYLGKNRILLCSLKNAKAPTPLMPVLPHGAHFVMLPNGELTLSIDNGIQLDAEQLAALPAIMPTVQEQYMIGNISNKIPEGTTTPQVEDDNVRIIEVSNETSSTVKYIDKPKESQDESPQNDNAVRCKDNPSEGKIVPTEIDNVNLNNVDGGTPLTPNIGNETVTQPSIQSEIIDTESECKKSVDFETADAQTKNQGTCETENVDESVVNIAQSTESLPTAEPQLGDTNNTCESRNTSSRKTILSDLMEMSGISAEDTAVGSDPVNPIIPLPPTVIPVTTPSVCNVLNLPTNINAPENITIAGPISNLLSLDPSVPLNNILRSIAQIKPDLNAVTSFAELKYVFENDGKFYKLDVEMGTISEIKVFIKNNPRSPRDITPTFIDLTHEIDDTDTSAEFRDVPQKKKETIEVKPIKLFKSVHPAILNHNNKSILKLHRIAYPKKVIRISKQRRKQFFTDNIILNDNVDTNEPMKIRERSSSYLDSSYDSSDEEPLAKKSKRNKDQQENIDCPLFEDAPKPPDYVSEEIVDISEVSNINEESGDASDIEMDNMNIEGVNPDFSPVAFEEGSDSDDMCILGV